VKKTRQNKEIEPPFRFNRNGKGSRRAAGQEARTAILTEAAQALPGGRVGRPVEIAEAIILLLSNGYMNAEVLHIEAGGVLSRAG
jgi:NAD(P)-dependent dehydrogenase (short-subunit alcohol dehydrogenase family)